MAAGDLFVEVTFTAIPAVNNSIEVVVYGPSVFTDKREVFKTVRTAPGEATIGANIQDSAINFCTAFNLDYTDYQATIVGNVVTIKNRNNVDFEYVESCDIVGGFAAYVFPQENNVIHVINFTPRQYAFPVVMQRNYLITESNDFLTTEEGKLIRL